MSTATLASPAVTGFAAAVRAALSDLTADEIDDLTDGLEADLTERIADGGAGDGELGDPIAYAEELRSAAGLPRRARSSSVFTDLRKVPGQLLRDARNLGARHPVVASLGRFFVSLRPLWWIFRAVAVTWVLVNFFQGYLWAPISGPAVILFLGLAIVSVQFGRGRWLPFAWMKGLLLAANIVLAIAAPFVIAGAATSVNNAWYSSNNAESYPDYSRSGLTLDGNPVSNVFAYDAQGNPLTDVQLFDQDGKPLNLVGDPAATTSSPNGIILIPNQSVAGRLGWNVYPLDHIVSEDLDQNGNIKRSAVPIPATAPFATAKPLADSETGVIASPTASAIPTATPTPVP